MSGAEPPALATWLMTRFTVGAKKESMIGDVIEEHRQRQSSAWYWRQALAAIWTSFANDVWEHKLFSIAAIALGTSTGQIYMLIVRPSWVASLDAWYPLLIDWLLKMEWDRGRHLAYGLQLHLLTGRITFCVFLGAVVWVMSRWHPRRRGLLVTVFLVTQVGLCIPYMKTALTDVLREPANPIWFFNALGFLLFTFIAIPMSVIVGAKLGKATESR